MTTLQPQGTTAVSGAASGAVSGAAGAARIGFIGLGNQGAPIARRMADAGWPLAVWARRPEALAEFSDVPACESPEALAERSDILCICVLDDAGVEDVVGRVLPHLPAGALIAVLSTTHPETCRRLAAAAAARGIALVDAPVSGGAAGAQAGTMAVMMGGTPEDCARLQPLFASFARLVERLGEVGAGQNAKLVNNALMAAILDVTQDARETGAALGLDLAALDKVLAASSGGSFAHNALVRLRSLSGFGHGARLLRKDIGLLAALCGDAAITPPPMIAAGNRFVDRTGA